MSRMTTLTKNGKTVKVVAGDNVDKEFRENGWTDKKESDAKTTTTSTTEKQETQPKTEAKSTSTSGSVQTSSTTKK